MPAQECHTTTTSLYGKPSIWAEEHPKTLAKITISGAVEVKDYSTFSEMALWSKRAVQARFLWGGGRLDLVQREVMGFINGWDAAFLGNKFQFVDAVRVMSEGYSAPKQVLVNRGETSDEITRRVNGVRFQTDKLYCKPLDGHLGRGIVVLPVKQVPGALANSKRLMVVQESARVEEDYRYWRIETPNEVWRYSYQGIRPSVVGDGISTVAALLARNGEIPAGSKIIAAVRNIGLLTTIPEMNEKLSLSPAAQAERGAYYKEVDPYKARYLDKFMWYFTTDLEKFVGHSLPVLCFDLGITNTSVFDQPFDLESMKKAITFFECQMPFDSGLDLRAAKRGVERLMVKYRFRDRN